MREYFVSLLMRCGLPRLDAETALAAYERTPMGEPYSADAVRVAAILNSEGAPCS